MDNMSQALKLAAGVILGILFLSLLHNMYQRYSVIPLKQAQAVKEKEIIETNKKFEVYKKSQMYGTDLISLINLVYEHNINEGNWDGRK